MSNKVKFGLSNVHYAVVNEVNGLVTYGTPKEIPGAVNMVQNPAGDPVEFYADNIVYFEESTNNGYTGTLEMALVPDEFRVDVLGDIIDANGAIIENADAKPKKFALMFEFDGDEKKTRHVNYRVSAARPNVESSTKTNTKTPVTETLNITVRPALDTGDVKGRLKQGQTGYDTFYSAVYLKNAVTNTAASATASFSKASPDDIDINVTSSDGTNTVKNVSIDGAWIPGIYLTVTGVDVSIADDYVAGLANGTYTITVEFGKGNAIAVALTVTA